MTKSAKQLSRLVKVALDQSGERRDAPSGLFSSSSRHRPQLRSEAVGVLLLHGQEVIPFAIEGGMRFGDVPSLIQVKLHDFIFLAHWRPVHRLITISVKWQLPYEESGR